MSILQLIFIIASVIFGLVIAVLVFINERKDNEDNVLGLPMTIGLSVLAFFGATILFLCCSVFLKIMIEYFLVEF